LASKISSTLAGQSRRRESHRWKNSLPRIEVEKYQRQMSKNLKNKFLVPILNGATPILKTMLISTIRFIIFNFSASIRIYSFFMSLINL